MSTTTATLTPGGGLPPPEITPDEGGGGDGDFVAVASFAHAWEAQLARGALAAEGIPTIVDDAATANPYPSLAAVGWGGVHVLVPENRVVDAQAVLRR